MIIIPPQSPGFVIYCCLGSVWWTILSCSMIWSCIDFSQTIKLKLSGLLVLTTILSNLWGHVCITSIVLFFCPLLFTMRCSVHRESLLHISEQLNFSWSYSLIFPTLTMSARLNEISRSNILNILKTFKTNDDVVVVCRKTDYYFNGRCFSLTFPPCITSLGILEVFFIS